MSNSIPKYWVNTKLGSVTEYGKSTKKTLNDVGDSTWILELEDIEKDSSRVIKRVNASNRPFKSTKNTFEKGNVLYGKLRPYLNKIILADENGVCSTEIVPIDAEPNCLNKYLFYWLKSSTFIDYVVDASYGVNMPRLGTKDGNAAPLVLAPFAEQQEIANQLDSLLAKVDSIKNRLDTVPNIIKRFRQSVLASAVSGKLTEDYRKETKQKSVDVRHVAERQFNLGLTKGNFGKKNTFSPDIHGEELVNCVTHIDGYPLVRIGAICESVVPNRDKPKTFSGGYHWLLTPHFSEQSIYIDYNRIERGLNKEEVNKYNAKIIKENNVIMTCVGRLGLSAILEENAVINQQLHAFIVNEYILPEYLAYCIRANQSFYESKATSTTIPYLNKTSCNSLPIPLPSINEQKVILEQVEQLLSFADKVEQKVIAAQERVNNLTQSILAKAFRGELTSEWRELNQALITGENSAEALLAKIKAERDALSKTQSTKKKPVKKQTTPRKAQN